MQLQDKDFRILRNLFDVEVMEKAVGDALPVLGGYVSTSSPDLVGDVIPPSAFEKWFENYKRNPIYCFDHNRNMPIGRVNNPRITDKGLYLENIVLSAVPIVKDYLSILIKDKVLSQQSIGFYAIKGHQDKQSGYFVHDEVFLYEGSLVSVACNPTATLDSIKSLIGNKFNLYQDEQEFFAAYDRGEVTKKYSIAVMDNPLYQQMPTILANELKGLLPENVDPTVYMAENLTQDKSRFSVSLNKWLSKHFTNDEQPSEPSVEFTELNMTNIIDLSNMKAISLTPEQKGFLDVDGEVIAKPNVKSAEYASVAPLLFASKIDNTNKTVFTMQVADRTEKGYNYNWNLVAEAMAKTLGAKGTLLMPMDTKQGIIARLAEAYEALGKKFPTFGEKDLDILSDAEFEEITFGNVEFHEDEKNLFTHALILNNIKQVSEALKSLEALPEDVTEALKSVFSYVDICVGVFPDGPDDTKLVTDIMALLDAYNAAEAEVESEESAPMSSEMVMDSLIDITIEALEARKSIKEEPKVEEVKPNFADNLLIEALKSFSN